MNEIDLSIIIPVYNAEKYLPKLFDSLREANDTIEVIFVNDGSSDSSGEKCTEFLKVFQNGKLINKKNGGVSSARNVGIETSSGKWIMFLDADDYLINGWSELIGHTLSEHSDSDVIIFGSEVKNMSYQGRKCAEAALSWSKSLGETGKSFCFPFSKIYSRHILENGHILFDTELINGEDMLFNAEAYLSSNAIVGINQSIYVYYKNMDSATNRFNPNIINTEQKFHQKLSELMKRFNLESDDEWKSLYEKSLLTGVYSLFYRLALTKDTSYHENVFAVVKQKEYESALYNLEKYKEYLSRPQYFFLKLIRKGNVRLGLSFIKFIVNCKRMYYRNKNFGGVEEIV
ncbi:MAG: glycosyltransferase [Clostridiales bacterium]|nr:glycosyltransferase [Clostridiales bacterium]